MAIEDWQSYHLYYHEDLTTALAGFVQPVVEELRRDGSVERFFFVRYRLGGPHIRLRLLPAAAKESELEGVVQRHAHELFQSRPSTQSLDPEAIRRETEATLSGDQNESDARIYDDNSWRRAEFVPETARYGGEALLPASLDFFCLSSLEALRFLASFGSLPRGKQLSHQLRFLIRQALGFAKSEEEFLALIGYGPESWGQAFEAAAQKAEATFERQQRPFCAMLYKEGEDFLAGESAKGAALTLGASALARALDGTEEAMRRQIGASHLHMSANRIGLLNPEEVYIGRLSQLAADGLRELEPEWWQALMEALPGTPGRDSMEIGQLSEMVDRELEQFSSAPSSSPSGSSQL